MRDNHHGGHILFGIHCLGVFLQLLGITSMTILIVFPLINLLLPGIEH